MRSIVRSINLLRWFLFRLTYVSWQWPIKILSDLMNADYQKQARKTFRSALMSLAPAIRLVFVVVSVFQEKALVFVFVLEGKKRRWSYSILCFSWDSLCLMHQSYYLELRHILMSNMRMSVLSLSFSQLTWTFSVCLLFFSLDSSLCVKVDLNQDSDSLWLLLFRLL